MWRWIGCYGSIHDIYKDILAQIVIRDLNKDTHPLNVATKCKPKYI